MKKVSLVFLAMAFLATSAFGANFSPSPLVLSAPEVIQYAFDGSNVTIPVTVAGSPANVMFFVYTKNKAATVSKVTNGYLGWHYMNKVDTCIYFSTARTLDKGSNTLTWDGKSTAKDIVPADEYTYYLWGYDGVSPKIPVTKSITMDHSTHSIIVTNDESGAPLPQPIFYKANGLQKWVIGNDPDDASLLETTKMCGNRQFLLDPSDYNYCFVDSLVKEVGVVAKYSRVPNGVSTLVTDWGTNSGMSIFHYGTNLTSGGGIAISGDYIITALYDRDSPNCNSALCYLDINDGTLVKTIDLSSRWASLDDQTAGGQVVGGPGQIYSRNNKVFLSTFNACYREMINPSLDEFDEKEYVLWGNGNGDYTGDHNFETTSPRPWLCFDYNVSPYAYVTDADANLFSNFGAYDMGAVSFGLIGPDGYGFGYYTFAGETAKFKQGCLYCDSGTPYDGIYTDDASSGTTVTGKGVYYLGQDSIKGTITNQVGVKEAAPTAFTVAQNSPNPFNPTTTISFTLAKAGKTTVEVYNVAGQKVSTLVNGSMSAGSHSVVWNAANVSAGVYFYTVKSGSFSKTMKMTLLK